MPLLFLIDAFCHADGTHGTNEATEVTADATFSVNVWLTHIVIEGDGLMAAVLA